MYTSSHRVSTGKLRLCPLSFCGDIKYERVYENVVVFIILTFTEMLYFFRQVLDPIRPDLTRMCRSILWYACTVCSVVDIPQKSGDHKLSFPVETL